MPKVDDVAHFLEVFAPEALAEDWDNVGLLIGDRRREVRRIMTCLTVTPASACEAVTEEADLIVSHHPLPFRELRRITSDTVEGRMLLELIAAGVAIYSPHTAFDSAARGINQQLAEGLGLIGIAPLRPNVAAAVVHPAALESEEPVPTDDEAHAAPLGSGRYGQLKAPVTTASLVRRIKRFLGIKHVQLVGEPERQVSTVAVACGSAGEFLRPARALGCELFVTGETGFHVCLEAEATGVSMVLVGHYASERFGVERLAEVLAEEFPATTVWASQQEASPLTWL